VLIIEKDMLTEEKARRKCLHHPAMECPTPNKPYVFTKAEPHRKRLNAERDKMLTGKREHGKK
jgi:hypothetical protein